jgi:hypothetical protein
VLMIIERIKEVKERMIRRNFIDYFEGIIE